MAIPATANSRSLQIAANFALCVLAVLLLLNEDLRSTMLWFVFAGLFVVHLWPTLNALVETRGQNPTLRQVLAAVNSGKSTSERILDFLATWLALAALLASSTLA